jgi:hypothetical protein
MIAPARLPDRPKAGEPLRAEWGARVADTLAARAGAPGGLARGPGGAVPPWPFGEVHPFGLTLAGTSATVAEGELMGPDGLGIEVAAKTVTIAADDTFLWLTAAHADGVWTASVAGPYADKPEPAPDAPATWLYRFGLRTGGGCYLRKHNLPGALALLAWFYPPEAQA